MKIGKIPLKTWGKQYLNIYQRTLIQWLIPPRCVLCLSKIQTPLLNSSLCTFCITSLPNITTSCAICSTPLKNHSLCGTCLNTQRYWNSCFAAFEYKGSIKILITEFKYRQNPSLGKLLGHLMNESIVNTYDKDLPDYLIPVPTFHDRLKSRGFNQSLILCEELSVRSNIPILDIIIKIKKTHAQKGLPSLKRKSSIKNSFQIKNIQTPRYDKIKKVAIIDDVMTTGSTSSEIAKLLKKSGISSIEVWVLART